MKDRIVYKFEELGDDLSRAPLAALRALLQSGLVVSPKGWSSLEPELREAIAREGVRGIVDTGALRKLMEKVPPRLLKLVPKSSDPDPDLVPQALIRALGPGRVVAVAQWRALRAVDRYVLSNLVSNTRLLWKAFDELSLGGGSSHEGFTESRAKWIGLVAHAELVTTPAAMHHVTSSRFLDGRAMILARTAGLRAARRIAEIFDLLAEAAPGPIELEWSSKPDGTAIVWQAHVSNYDGAFFPAASLVAAMTAATALHDMIREHDSNATITNGSIREETWLAVAREAFDDATVLYSHAPPVSSKSPVSDLVRDITPAPGAGATPIAQVFNPVVDAGLPHSNRQSSAPAVEYAPRASASAPHSQLSGPESAAAKRMRPRSNYTATVLLAISIVLFVATSGLVAYVLLVARR